MATNAEVLVREKSKKFVEFAQSARWEDLAKTCYAPDARLDHFASPGKVRIGRDSIRDFFASGPLSGGYALDLQFTVVKMASPTACLIAGVGSVNKGPWCPFVERWELVESDSDHDDDGEWFIKEDKVYPSEAWMQ